MLYDKNIRDDLCLFLEEKYGKVRFFDELRIGNSRADMVMVTEHDLIGIEIKSDADSYARLPTQIRDYDAYCDASILVIGSSHAAHAAEHVPEHWGVITVEWIAGRLDFYLLRETGENRKVRLTNQLSLLWRREFAELQARNGLYKYPGKSKAYVKKYVMEKIPAEELKKQMLDVLFNRDYTIFEN